MCFLQLWYNSYMHKIIAFFKKYCPMSLTGWFVFSVVMIIGAAICVMLRQVTETDSHVPLIFVLMVLITALLTNGYFFGILASVVSVFAVNWAFTYPYMQLDFSLYGYPLTFITLLTVSIAASMLASGLKEREKLKRETEAEKARATLLRSVSHDIRTPLTSISGSISTVLNNGSLSDDNRRELLKNARDDAEWLCRMVENLLSVTNIDGSSEIAKSEELVEEIIGEAVSKFKKNYPGIAVTVKCIDEPVFVYVDATLIRQVFNNLFENAVVHGKTTTEILVSTRFVGENELGIFIRDNGCGIDKNLLSHLFDGHLMLDIHNDDSSRYIGIGLAVCSTIVKAHGGRISAHNIPGGGAEFMFTLLTAGGSDENQR